MINTMNLNSSHEVLCVPCFFTGRLCSRRCQALPGAGVDVLAAQVHFAVHELITGEVDGWYARRGQPVHGVAEPREQGHFELAIIRSIG